MPARATTEHARRCLAALVELDGVEVIFLPDAPPDGLDPRVRSLTTGELPVGSKRQLGLEAARAPIVALIDDDAYPHPSWLANVLDAFETDPAVAAVCGPTLTPPDEPEGGVIGGRVYATPLVGGPHRWRYHPAAACDVDDAPTVNLAMRTEVALAVRLDSPYYPGDDTIVCDRIVRRGGRIRYVPGAIVYHSRRPLWRPHLRQIWGFGRHRGAFARYLGGNSRRPSYAAPSALVVWVAGGALLGGRPRRAWTASLWLYAAACLLAGADRSPRSWWRISAAIPATHATYGVGFLLSIVGVPLAEGRIRRVAVGDTAAGCADDLLPCKATRQAARGTPDA